MHEFHPHPWLFNGHLQTCAGMFGALPAEQATRRIVDLPDGDQLIIHDDCPPHWQSGDRVAILVHGLCGSYRSSYMVRIAQRLRDHGIRTCRLDMRGCGAGLALAHYPYHSGRADDIRQALIHAHGWFPNSPLTVIAFSLGANTTLKMLGEYSSSLPATLDQAIVVSPPIDLARCVASLEKYPGRAYDRFFSFTLIKQVHASPRLGERAANIFSAQTPTRLIDFDDMFTAPLSGFRSAAHYYARSSANQYLSEIAIPTTIIMAQDDPIVPWDASLHELLSPTTRVLAPAHGGHLGFIGTRQKRWLDDTISQLIQNKKMNY